MREEKHLVIHFNTGAKSIIAFPKQVEDMQLGTAIKDAMQQDKLVVEADGELLVCPWTSIRYIQVSPAPSKLPPTAIQGARLVE